MVLPPSDTLPTHSLCDDDDERVHRKLYPVSHCWPRGLFAFFLSLGSVVYFLYPVSYPWYPQSHLPPLYPEFHQRDLRLPQHNPTFPIPEGREGRYIWIANQVRGMEHVQPNG